MSRSKSGLIARCMGLLTVPMGGEDEEEEAAIAFCGDTCTFQALSSSSLLLLLLLVLSLLLLLLPKWKLLPFFSAALPVEAVPLPLPKEGVEGDGLVKSSEVSQVVWSFFSSLIVVHPSLRSSTSSSTSPLPLLLLPLPLPLLPLPMTSVGKALKSAKFPNSATNPLPSLLRFRSMSMSMSMFKPLVAVIVFVFVVPGAVVAVVAEPLGFRPALPRLSRLRICTRLPKPSSRI